MRRYLQHATFSLISPPSLFLFPSFSYLAERGEWSSLPPPPPQYVHTTTTQARANRVCLLGGPLKSRRLGVVHICSRIFPSCLFCTFVRSMSNWEGKQSRDDAEEEKIRRQGQKLSSQKGGGGRGKPMFVKKEVFFRFLW